MTTPIETLLELAQDVDLGATLTAEQSALIANIDIDAETHNNAILIYFIYAKNRANEYRLNCQLNNAIVHDYEADTHYQYLPADLRW